MTQPSRRQQLNTVPNALFHCRCEEEVLRRTMTGRRKSSGKNRNLNGHGPRDSIAAMIIDSNTFEALGKTRPRIRCASCRRHGEITSLRIYSETGQGWPPRAQWRWYILCFYADLGASDHCTIQRRTLDVPDIQPTRRLALGFPTAQQWEGNSGRRCRAFQPSDLPGCTCCKESDWYAGGFCLSRSTTQY